MCWMCDHPDASQQDYLNHIESVVEDCGWAVQAVERDQHRPPYAYTIGLTTHGKPELVVTGMPVLRAAELLNDVTAHLLHAPEPEPGEQVPLIGGPVIEFVAVEVPSAHLSVASVLYGPRLRALQVVHADDRGHWPWEVGYRGVRGGQPVLGPRAQPLAGSARSL
jgi:Domain of unknown function (DUF4262)